MSTTTQQDVQASKANVCPAHLQPSHMWILTLISPRSLTLTWRKRWIHTPELDPLADKWHPAVGQVKQDGKNKVKCEEYHRYLKNSKMRVEHVRQFHPLVSYDCMFCPGLVFYTTQDLFNHCKKNHLICDLCSSALKDQKALQPHNDKHHKKPAAAAKMTLQPAPLPAPTDVDTPEGAEVPSADDTTTPAADTSTASEANIHPDCQGFTCVKCNVFCLTRTSFEIHWTTHKTVSCLFCMQKFFNTAS